MAQRVMGSAERAKEKYVTLTARASIPRRSDDAATRRVVVASAARGGG